MNADDPKFTAHALGELEDLSPAECAEIDALIARDSAAAAEAAEIRTLAGRLRAELPGEAAPALAREQRTAVLNAVASPRKKRIVRFPRAAKVLGAIAACLVVGGSMALILPGMPGVRGSRATKDLAAIPPKTTSVEARTAIPANETLLAPEAPALVVVPAAPSLVLEGVNTYGGATSLGTVAENPFVAVLNSPISIVPVEAQAGAAGAAQEFLPEVSKVAEVAGRIVPSQGRKDLPGASPQGGTPFTTILEVATCPWAPEHRLVRVGLKTQEALTGVAMEVDFNPAQVRAYRLLRFPTPSDGAYAVAADFAGEVLYELVPAGDERLYASVDKLERSRDAAKDGNGQLQLQLAPVPHAKDALAAATPGLSLDGAPPAASPPPPAAPAEDRAELLPPHSLKPSTDSGRIANPAPQGAAHAELLPPHRLKPRAANPGAPKPESDAKAYLVNEENKRALVAAEPFSAASAIRPNAPAGTLVVAQLLRLDALTLRVRYTPAQGGQGQQLEFGLRDEGRTFENSSADFHFLAAVAATGLLLHDSPERGSATWDEVAKWTRAGLGANPGEDRKEFLRLIEKARASREK